MSKKSKHVPGDTVTRHVGFCAICEGDFKLTADDKLVHHGYKRPGIGYIVGDCMAVDYEPYERSKEVLEKYVALVKNQLDNFRKQLARLKSGKVHYFETTHSRGYGRHAEQFTRSWSRFVTPAYDFEREMESRIPCVEMDIRATEREVARIEKWIAEWVLKPVRTMEEIFKAAKEKKAEQKARLDAARKAREDKRAAIDAKHAAQEAKKAAARQHVIDEAKRLAAALRAAPEAMLDDKAFRKSAEKLSTALKNLHWSVSDKLGVDRELVLLGLGRMESYGFHSFGYFSLAIMREEMKKEGLLPVSEVL